jgi:RimJ/RimL family protein N-acetyltransferase
LAKNLLPAAFAGQFIRLRPVARSDHPVLFAQRIAPHVSQQHVHTAAIPSFERWEATELADLLSSGPAFIAEGHDGVFGGLLRLFRIEPRDRRSYAEFRLSPDMDGAALMEAFLLFLDYAFAQFNLRRLYCETPSLNRLLISRLEKAGFEEEVRLREYLCFGPTFADLLFFAVSEAAWGEARRHLSTSLDLTLAQREIDPAVAAHE